MTKITLTIGPAIKRRGWTQKQLAIETGLREATVSQLARGYVDRVDLRTLERIANALDVKDIRDLLDLTEEE